MFKNTKPTAILVALLAAMLSAQALAQSAISTRRAVDAAILSDIARDRQAEREARRQPYATPGYGSISTATGARKACAAKALGQAGPGSKLVGQPSASTMSTGWEVEGGVEPRDGRGPVSFVCSVRNGSVSGILLQP